MPKYYVPFLMGIRAQINNQKLKINNSAKRAPGPVPSSRAPGALGWNQKSKINNLRGFSVGNQFPTQFPKD